jgi:hypothetical protein
VHPAPPPGQPAYPPVGAVVVAPYWWGWSWGWGYYPFYPGPAGLPAGGEAPPPDQERISASVHGTASGDADAGVAGLSFAIDGERAGFHGSIEAIRVDTPSAGSPSSTQSLGWGSLHGSWSIVSERTIRVRFELGGSMLTMADSGGVPYAGTSVYGPSIGVSGHLGLVGPIGVEGHARITPSPVVVTDSRIALALRGGPFAFTVGYRSVAVSGDGTRAPELDLGGPEFGLGFRF